MSITAPATIARAVAWRPGCRSSSSPWLTRTGWSIFFTMLFGTGVAVFVAAWFALSMWGVVQLAR